MFKTKILASLSALIAAFMVIAVAGANVSNTTDDVIEIAAPSTVVPGGLESDSDIRLFKEAEGIVLSKAVRVDIKEPGNYRSNRGLTRGRIPRGTEVNSYMLHSDPVGKPKKGLMFEGSVTFDEEILGIIVKSSRLKATDGKLGSDVTRYPKRSRLRGLELRRRADGVMLSDDRRTVTVRFKTSIKVDQIRVITAPGIDVGGDEGGEVDTLAQGLLGHWTFEDGSGQSVTDNSGNGNNGILGNSSSEGSDDPSWTTDSAIGEYAMEFDGANDFVNVGDKPEFELPAYSWSLWLKAPNPPGSSSIGQPFSNADEQFVASWDHTQSGFIASAAHKTGDDWIGVQIGSPLSGGVWYHITATYDGSELKIYLNGTLEDSEFVGTPNTNSGNLQFGAGYTAGGPASFFEGKIDEVRFYDRALTDEEIASLANR